MAIKTGQYYLHAPEKWNARTCARAVQHFARDGMGTRYPQRGMHPGVKCGRVRYNGGCLRPDWNNGDWYEGEEFVLPTLAKGYAWVYVPTWCWKIVKLNKVTKPLFDKIHALIRAQDFEGAAEARKELWAAA